MVVKHGKLTKKTDALESIGSIRVIDMEENDKDNMDRQEKRHLMKMIE